MVERPVFIDIDGTLTSDGERAWAPILPGRIAIVRDLIAAGVEVVIWSARGTQYVEQFCSRNGIIGAVMVGKPDTMVDDTPTIRTPGKIEIMAPQKFFLEGGT